MHRALPPFEPPDGVLKRRLALAVIGGARPRGDRYLSAIARLQGFSSCSPAAIPHQWAVWWGEASRAAASAPPSASRIFVIRAEAEERTEWGVASTWVGNPFLPPAFGGERHPPAPWTGCSFPSFVRAAVVPRASGHVQVLLAPSAAPGGRPTRRTPRGRCSCSGEASARTGVRTYRCVLGRPLFAGVVSVGSNPQSVPSDSSALAACPRPSCGDVGEGLFTAVFVLRSSLLLFSRPRWRSLSLLLQRSPASRLEFVIPRAPWCGGCSYPREWNRSPVCKEIYRVFAGVKCNCFKYLDTCRGSGEPPRVPPTSKSV
jgi:hypothetical protein